MDVRHLIAFILIALMAIAAVVGIRTIRYNSPRQQRRRDRARSRAARH